MATVFPHFRRRIGFTLIELLVVMAIISIMAAISIPAIKSLTKSNDQSQATNLVRSMVSSARSIAVSQHRMAGVVFFEESSLFSSPVNKSQTAMQLFVEDYDQNRAGYGNVANLGHIVFLPYSSARQYLPAGTKLATLSDSGLQAAENISNNQRTRAILFNANGQLVNRSGLCTPDPFGGPGQSTYALGDWEFLRPNNNVYADGTGPSFAASSPGFFLYNKNEFDAQSFANDGARATWLKQHSDVVLINANTGNVIR